VLGAKTAPPPYPCPAHRNRVLVLDLRARHDPEPARTNTVRHSARMSRRLEHADVGWRRHLFQEPDVAALSVGRAATDPSVHGGEFFGPDGRFGLTGRPALTRAAPLVYDRKLQRRVWAASERLNGVRYDLPAGR
jgi:hypothetical protein